MTILESLHITPDSTIREVIAANRGTSRVLMDFGMHCFGCPMATAETLREACAAHGADIDELMDQLTAYFEDQEG